MHPAPSVIIFTTLSGLGFGLFAFLGFGVPDVTGWAAFAYFFIAYALTVGGLSASVFHLGNPRNAVKSFSQWRTSWLAREGVLAVATLLVMAPYAFGRIFLGGAPQSLGIIAAVLALLTVFSTGMIYTQLKTIPRWNQPTTPILYELYAVGGGALLAGRTNLAALLLLILGLVQVYAWVNGDRRFAESGSTAETATGLGFMGKVRLLEPPHSGRNYLLDEMVHVIGRKHARKLRLIAILGAVVLPVAAVLLLPVTMPVLLLAVVVHLIGLFAGRWLFFAEAEHVVRLYYGK